MRDLSCMCTACQGVGWKWWSWCRYMWGMYWWAWREDSLHKSSTWIPEGVSRRLYVVDKQNVILLPKFSTKENFFVSRLIVFNETFARLGADHEPDYVVLWHEGKSAYLPTIPADSPELLRKSTSNYYIGEPAIRLFTAFTATCAAAYHIHSDSANCMRQVTAHSLRRLVSRSFIRCHSEIQRMGTRVMATTRPNQMFEEGHVCILRGVTRTTLIFLLDLLKLLQLESEWDSHWHCDWLRRWRSLDSLSSPASGCDSCDYVFHASAWIGKQPLTFLLNLVFLVICERARHRRHRR